MQNPRLHQNSEVRLKPLSLKVPTIVDPSKYDFFLNPGDPNCLDKALKAHGSQKYNIVLHVFKSTKLLLTSEVVKDSYLR